MRNLQVNGIFGDRRIARFFLLPDISRRRNERGLILSFHIRIAKLMTIMMMVGISVVLRNASLFHETCTLPREYIERYILIMKSLIHVYPMMLPTAIPIRNEQSGSTE